MACNNCGQDWPIVNKIHGLCQKCNWERLYGKDYKPKKYSLKPISAKEIIRKQAKNELYAKMDADIDNRKCGGCGTYNTLTHSHLVPVSRNKNLENNPLNVVYHCLINNCHSKWESCDLEIMSTMIDFDDNMEKVKILDPEYYNILISKI